MRRRGFLAALGASALLAACAQARTPAQTPGGILAANPALGVWPQAVLRAGSSVRGAYSFAATHEAILRYIPCFCGCGAGGHRSNYDCFVRIANRDGWLELDSHGFGCGTCIGVALDAKALSEQGASISAVRAAIDAKWAKTGPSTPTALP